MPLIIGCTVVAEERRLGVMEEQFCLPTSRRLQFALKFLPTILFGTLLGGFMPLLLERTAAFFGAPNPDFHFTADDFLPINAITGLALGLSLAGFFASTISKNFLQALGAAVVTIIGCCLFTSFARHLYYFYLFRLSWNPSLTIGIAILTVLVAAPLLSYYNFKYVQERGRVWRRNVFGLTGAILFIFIFSAALYNRAWEVFEPAEPAHGPAIFSLANPPVLHTEGYEDNKLLAQLPDGRVWYDQIGYRSEQSGFCKVIRRTFNPLPSSVGPLRFVNGSNWVSYAIRRLDFRPDKDAYISPSFLETVGIKSDGTLWVSGKSDSPLLPDDHLTQFGDDTNWQAVSWSPPGLSVWLLKKDGSLWRWDTGTNKWDWNEAPSHWPALQNFNPHQIGTNSDWSKISFNIAYLQKDDGSVWLILKNSKDGKYSFSRDTNWDQVDLEKIPQDLYRENCAYVQKDGTLWIRIERWGENSHSPVFETFQSGKETNWISAVSTGWSMGMMVALKSDGTLWQWPSIPQQSFEGRNIFPNRLGIHNDWVALSKGWDGVVALAADGSLWFWPDDTEYRYPPPLMKLPKQPQFLGNIFAKPD